MTRDLLHLCGYSTVDGFSPRSNFFEAVEERPLVGILGCEKASLTFHPLQQRVVKHNEKYRSGLKFFSVMD